ncbi:PaaI family thioesterase [soil metagenome]
MTVAGDRRYGTASVEERAKPGLEFVRGLVDGRLPLNTMARAMGYDVVEATEGRVVVSAVPTAELLNPEGTVHGGFAATLLDAAMGLAIRTRLAAGIGSTTLEFKVTFMRPITPETGLVRGEGVVLGVGRRVGSAEGRLTDGSGKLLVHATTSCLIFDR